MLYGHSIKRELAQYKMQAALHGIKLDDKAVAKKEEESRLLFKDPKEYDHLSDEEKEALTQEMMGHYKNLAGQMQKHGMGAG